MDKTKTGELIRDARKAKNYTQSELGDLLAVSNKAVSRWEKGESFPDIGVLESLAQVLNLKIQDLVTGEIQPNEEISTEHALAELLRQSRIQLREKKKRILRIMFAFTSFLCGILAGVVGLGSRIYFDNLQASLYYVLLALTLALVVYERSIQGYDTDMSNRIGRVSSIISCVSLLWAVLMTGTTSLLVVNGYTPFSMELRKVGQ